MKRSANEKVDKRKAQQTKKLKDRNASILVRLFARRLKLRWKERQ